MTLDTLDTWDNWRKSSSYLGHDLGHLRQVAQNGSRRDQNGIRPSDPSWRSAPAAAIGTSTTVG